ncbi:UPF0261 domain protein [Penicillium brasilianum]|uniref:UPF0261 domain protein n=1 Tax=Penicillium brasilianum TaxID=104259 RepID=A0A1S9RJ64_PENBI|nr:UPF0261 domain protein [Penicillium brasilianum]
MPPTINIDLHKDFVLGLYEDRIPLPDICKALKEQHGVSITSKTLRRRIEDWGIKGGRTAYRSSKDDALRALVRKLVCEEKLPTKKVLEVLAEEGFTMSDTTLRRMRKDLGIVLRNDDPVKLARQRDRMRRRRQLEIALDGQLPTRLVNHASIKTPPTIPTILLLGTCDTKLSELLFTKSRIEKTILCQVQIMDIGRNPVTHDNITFPQEIYSSYFTSLKRPTVEIQTLDRTEYIDTLAPYASSFASHLFAEQKVHAILGVGGSCGTALATQVMRDGFPVGFPKMMVSTMASGDVGPYIGETDITMMYSVVDIAGRNRLLERVLGNAASAIAGMARTYFEDVTSKSTLVSAVSQGQTGSEETSNQTPSQSQTQSRNDAVRIGITMFGVTTPAATAAREHLETILPGCEVYVFHATGSGGKAMERLISEDQLDAVLDLTTTEIADEVVGGVLSAGPTRLCAATKKNIPRVISPGACDVVNFGTPDSVPAIFAHASQPKRVFHRHNSTVTLMRTTEEECIRIAKLIATNLLEGNAGWESNCRTKVILPLEGLSLLDTPQSPFWNPVADRALFSTLEDELRGSEILVVRDSRPINDPGFAVAAADMLCELIRDHRGEQGSSTD